VDLVFETILSRTDLFFFLTVSNLPPPPPPHPSLLPIWPVICPSLLFRSFFPRLKQGWLTLTGGRPSVSSKGSIWFAVHSLYADSRSPMILDYSSGPHTFTPRRFIVLAFASILSPLAAPPPHSLCVPFLHSFSVAAVHVLIRTLLSMVTLQPRAFKVSLPVATAAATCLGCLSTTLPHLQHLAKSPPTLPIRYCG